MRKITYYRLNTNLPINGAGECHSEAEWLSRYGYINITSTETNFFQEETCAGCKKDLNSLDDSVINKDI